MLWYKESLLELLCLCVSHGIVLPFSEILWHLQNPLFIVSLKGNKKKKKVEKTFKPNRQFHQKFPFVFAKSYYLTITIVYSFDIFNCPINSFI